MELGLSLEGSGKFKIEQTTKETTKIVRCSTQGSVHQLLGVPTRSFPKLGHTFQRGGGCCDKKTTHQQVDLTFLT